MVTLEHTSLPSRTALVLFGTETGTSQDIAYETSRILERYRFDTEVCECDEIQAQSLAHYSLVVFVLSTTGQGDFPGNARKFWTSILKKKLESTFLLSVNYAVVGLGDSSYPKFNWAARKLHKRLQQLGAKSLLQPCEADEQSEDSTDGAFIAWAAAFRIMLDQVYPLSNGIQPIPSEVPLPSKWTLDLRSKHAKQYNDNAQIHGGGNHTNNAMSKKNLQLKVTLQQNSRVTPLDHWQDVRLLQLVSETKVDYLPGDALAIRPQNDSSDVSHLIELMNWIAIADEPLRLILKHKSAHFRFVPDSSLSTETEFTLRQLLTSSMDINAIPRRSFFGAIAQYTDNEMHKERLLEFIDPQYLDEYYDYATRPRRSIVEVLQEFDSVKIPWQECINVLPFLRPRQFSIASGGELKRQGKSFDLLVAIVKYKTVIKRIRQGVCTKYLAELPVGSTFDVVLKTEGRLHTEAQLNSMNHILIGAGTGIAPLRAIVYEKLALKSTGSNTMIFGCRNAESDYFFKQEWEKLENGNKSSIEWSFEMITAFSRDQKTKIYVQDRIIKNAANLRDLVLNKNAAIVVCGSSGPMPKAIRQAFVTILSEQTDSTATHSLMSVEEAEAILTSLEKQGRYKQETCLSKQRESIPMHTDAKIVLPSTAAHTRPNFDIVKVILPGLQPQVEPVSGNQDVPPPLHPPAMVNSKHSRLQNSIKNIQHQIALKKIELGRNLEELRQEDESMASHTDEAIIQDAEQIVAKHIKLLHGYNETKDIGLGLLGLIADKEGRRLGEIMEERGVSDKD